MNGPGFGGFFGGMPPFFMVFFFIILCFIVFTIVSMIKSYHRNATSPILTEHAKVIAKRTEVSHHHYNTADNHSHSSSHTRYYVTFETDAGQRMELTLSGKEFGLIAEGDIGNVTYQGEWYKTFKRDVL
ncbi:DUF2500 domain-containing protein [Clostridium sp. JNZ J1-5]